MDHIDEMLTTHSFDKNLNTSIRASLAMGKKTLDRYSLTDMSQMYRIAMGTSVFTSFGADYTNEPFKVLHPRNKLNYFKNAGWEADWIKTASDLVRDEFDLLYADIAIDSDNNESHAGSHEPDTQKVCQFINYHGHS
jgi:hypothetical protein